MSPSQKRLIHKPRRSLQTILIVWFLLFSIVPLAFVTGYSLVKYEEAINNELVRLLRANARELHATIVTYEKSLNMNMQRHQADTALITNLAINNVSLARTLARTSLRNSVLSSLSLFNREGRLVALLTQDEGSDARENQIIQTQEIFLKDAYKEILDSKGRLAVVNPGAGNSLDLVVMSALKTRTGRHAGYVEEVINIGQAVLQGLRDRLNLEIMLFDSSGKIVAGSHPDFVLYKKDLFASTVANKSEVFFDLNVRNIPYGFIITSAKWGDSTFLIGLGASKQNSKGILKNINYAFFTVAGVIVILVLIMALLSARVVMRPLNDLLQAIRRMEVSDTAVEIPIQSENELGVLTESFNEMSRRVSQARSDLEKKIKELEHAYSELQDAQAKLVHAAKMASLGQLVAGVAHELNNPIGFIYSNMSHLRDYSNRLLRIIDTAESQPTQLSTLKTEVDFDYVTQDLPRLIQSCEDGARRVRDIVLGLRSFSRLEEAKIKKVDILEGIEQTLRLLSGELKGRIRVHTEFAELPEVLCYASQLNQVFMNILSNAAQAIEGEGDIWVKATHEPASASAKGTGKGKAPSKAQSKAAQEGESAGESIGGRVHISVRDSGKGMPADVVEKIFDPFFTTKGVGEGTGLGLSISYGIVKKHSGDITVTSEIGKGTEFTITLPVDGPT